MKFELAAGVNLKFKQAKFDETVRKFAPQISNLTGSC